MWLPCGGGSTPPPPHSMKWCMTPSTFPHDQPHVCHATDALHHTSPIAMMPQSTTTRQPHAYHEVLEGQVAHLPLPHLLLLFLPTFFPSHLISSPPPSSPSSPSHGTNCINVHTCTTDMYICTYAYSTYICIQYIHMHTVHTYVYSTYICTYVGPNTFTQSCCLHTVHTHTPPYSPGYSSSSSTGHQSCAVHYSYTYTPF